MISYSVTKDVQADEVLGRPALITPQGGKVAIDERILRIWQFADGRTLDECLKDFRTEVSSSDSIRAALACLVEAGLLQRRGSAEEKHMPGPWVGDLVSVLIISYNGQKWLEVCLPSLLAQTYSPLQAIVVDNGSADDTETWLKCNFPGVTVFSLEKTKSLAAAINYGFAHAKGKHVLILNQDVQLERDAIFHLVEAAKSQDSCAAVAAKLRFWWAPSFLNGLGNRVDPSSWGSDVGIGHLDLGQFDGIREVPSACFAVALVVRSVWEDVGPVDEGFPLYYEDSEWCYRARLLGYRIAAAPRSVVYHAFGGGEGSEESDLPPSKLRNAAYGRLRFALKLLDARYARRFLLNYLAEDCRNVFMAITKRDWRTAQAYGVAWMKWLRSLPEILRKRKHLHARRVRRDEDVFRLQRLLPTRRLWMGIPELAWGHIESDYLPLIRSGRTNPMPEFGIAERQPHLLIVSNDVVDIKMAGPGVRYLEMARALRGELDVTLAIPSETSLQEPSLRLVRYWEDRPDSLKLLVDNADIVLISGYMVEKFLFLETTERRLVVDLYDPFLLENLHYYQNDPPGTQDRLNNQAVEVTNRLARLGDFFICGSERQRDFWLGVLAANQRINPSNFKKDPSLRSLIDVVGIGFPGREPSRAPLLRGKHVAFTDETRIVLWGGGIWNWLDPLTLIRAWPEVLERHPEARLVFLGTRHPNPNVPEHEMAQRAISLAEEISEKDETIFFYEWLPYEKLESLLTEADIGVTLHPDQVETRFSIRTRVLDCFWARLPIVITEGDVVSDWVRDYGVGKVVPPHDEAAVADSICELLEKPKAAMRPGFGALREMFNWEHVVKPLIDNCLHGAHAPDWEVHRKTGLPQASAGRGQTFISRALSILREEGLLPMMRRVLRHLRWRLAR